MSYKELAREARKLIISARKKGTVLKLADAMNIVNNGVYTKNGSPVSLTRSPLGTKPAEDNLTFSSAPSVDQNTNAIYGNKLSTLRLKKKASSSTSTPSTTWTSSTTTTTSPTTTGTTSSQIPASGGGWGGGTSSTPTWTTTSTTPAPSQTTTSTTNTTTVWSGGTNASWSTTQSGASSTVSVTGTGTSSSGSTSTWNTSSNTGTDTSNITFNSAPSNQNNSSNTMLPITSTENPQLKKLAEYQKLNSGFVTNELMVFLNMPESAANIEWASYYIANTANEFAKYGITPIFVIEPYGDNGQLNLGKIKNGDYIAKLDSLFSLLKWARWLTEDKLGILVPYPEINTPAFDRTNFVPTDLPILVNQYFDVVRKYYPNAHGGLLLDGKSYDVNKTWGQGEYKSYSPYISGITAGYISYFWVQGFPWVSNDGSDKFYDPAIFLPINLGKEAASILSLNNIWFNTGTMKRSYRTNTVSTSPQERQTMMNGIINQGKALQSQWYAVTINIFAENKFQTDEAVDWSYIENASDGILSADESVFTSFLSQAKDSGITVALFDM